MRKIITRDEKGTILVVAIMVLLALAGLALLSVRSTFYEIRSASNHNMARMSYFVADGGTGGMVAYAYNNPQSFVSLAYSGGMKVTAETLGIRSAMWDLSAGGSLGFAALGAPDAWTVVDSPTTLDFYPGSSVGEFCAEKHTWRTHGSLGTPVDSSLASTKENPQYGEKVVMTQWLIGPIDCVGGN